jgi:hypothetical protein
VLEVEAVIVFQVDPLSVEYSSLTLATVPVVVHVILEEAPTLSVLPPLGEVRLRTDLILNACDVPVVNALLELVTLISAVLLGVFSTDVQLYEPVFGADETMVVQLEPLLVEY